MTETTKQKEAREKREAAQLAAREKAQADKKAADEAAEAAKKDQQEKDKKTTDADLVQKANKTVADNEDKKEKDALDALEEAKKNDEKPSKDNLISTVHDETIDAKLAQASTKKARAAAAENYRLQQERQKQLEIDTQRGLGFNGVKSDGKKDDK